MSDMLRRMSDARTILIENIASATDDQVADVLIDQEQEIERLVGVIEEVHQTIEPVHLDRPPTRHRS